MVGNLLNIFMDHDLYLIYTLNNAELFEPRFG